MKRLIVLLLGALALCLPAAPSYAQQIQYKVVSACGTLGATPSVGSFYWGTMTADGQQCAGFSGSITAALSATASASPTAVIAGTGKPLNMGLFSNLFASLVDSGGNFVDLSAAGSGIGATAAAVPANAVLKGCRAATAAPTAVTDGQMVAGLCGAEGKTIMLPYAIKELAVRGSTGAVTNTTQTSIIASAGGSLKNYITAIQCANSGASTSILTFTDAAATVLINPAGGGGNWQFPIPLVTAAATAFQVTPGSSSTSQYCSAQGYTGL